jgi:hypothetical protein
MIKQHAYRFGASGKPLAAFFKSKRIKEKRSFPKFTQNVKVYVREYFLMNNYFVGN